MLNLSKLFTKWHFFLLFTQKKNQFKLTKKIIVVWKTEKVLAMMGVVTGVRISKIGLGL